MHNKEHSVPCKLVSNKSVPNNSIDIRERAGSAFAVVAIHVAFGFALINGFGVDVVGTTQRTLIAFNLDQPPASPPPVEKELLKSKEAQGAASAKNLKAKATPVVAPKPVVKLTTKQEIRASEIPRKGTESNAGASNESGPGAGSGGQGDGSGAGGRGNGGGGLIIASRARLISGAINNSDYPRAAARANIGGTVTAFYTVLASGRVTGCQVKRSSGNSELDAITCRLIEQRFRYDPARDSEGNAIIDVTGWQQKWWLGSRDSRD